MDDKTMNPMHATLLLAIAVLFASTAVAADAVIDSSTLRGKMLMGYQGWFGAPGDGSRVDRWFHWGRLPDKLTVDMWPDVSELSADELIDTGLRLPDGAPARLYSAYKPATVIRHFSWMKDAGIDGVLLQRFLEEAQDPRYFDFRNQVTHSVMEGCERFGRVFAIEYDMAPKDPEMFKRDWMFLVDELKVTQSGRYLHHKGNPVVCLWGFGFTHRGDTPDAAQAILDWLKHDAPAKYQATVVGGVPAHWRTGGGDAFAGEKWAKVFRSFDVISPWTVGRYHNLPSADRFCRDFIVPDLEETRRLGIDYLPVIWPGFSWRNLHNGPLNQIPRLGGRFYWRQATNAVAAGSVMLKTAMFDEVDEATAMFKLATTKKSLPQGCELVPLDADGVNLPSDWYLRLSGEATRLIRGEIPTTSELPLVP